ncbi:MAG: carbohydrate kinase [Alphaproteobacteria bacterium]|nr:MAG: carbohydrate kinase [Alphaproteobacteria bacterium]
MSGARAVGIDVGTGGVRAVAVDASGRIVGQAAAAMAEFGADRRDPALWAAALEAALERLSAQCRLGAVEAVAVDGTSGTVLGLDRAGDPVGGALMYDDAVADAGIVAAIEAAAPRRTAARGASSGLARAIVLQDRPGVRAIRHQADWIAGLLAEAPPPSDESNALKTGYDPMARRWPDWLRRTPLRPGLLPPVVASGSPSGRLSGRFGLPAGGLLVAGLTDGCASFLATGAARPGDCVTALGTTLTVKLLSDRPVFAPEHGIYSHRIGEMWLAGGASNSGGGALAAHFTPARIAALSRRIDPDRPSGLDYYPLPRPGERFPLADPALQPRIAPRPDDDALFLQGLFEGIARIEALGYRRLAELGATAPRRLFSVGGGAANPVWTRIRARIVGLPMAEALSDAAAAGAARLALGCLGRAG